MARQALGVGKRRCGGTDACNRLLVAADDRRALHEVENRKPRGVARRAPCRRQRGEHNQAVGRSRGRRATKIHALTDQFCRPIAFVLTGGHVPDCIAAEIRLPLAPEETQVLHGDKGYDGAKVHRQIERQGAAPNIPPKTNRKYKPSFSPARYRNRKAIERSFCRLKDFRRIATRYDKLSRNFLAAVQLAATVCYWL